MASRSVRSVAGRVLSLLLPAAALAVAGCDEILSPEPSEEVIVGGVNSDTGLLWRVDVHSERVRPIGPMLRHLEGGTYSSDGRTLYLTFSGAGVVEVVELDLRTATIRDRFDPLGTEEDALRHAVAPALSADERLLVLPTVRRPDAATAPEVGVVLFDFREQRVVKRIYPFDYAAAMALPPSDRFPNGALLIAGGEFYSLEDEPRDGVFLFLDGETLEVTDTVRIQTVTGHRGGIGDRLLADPAGRYIYTQTYPHGLIRFDLTSLQLTASSTEPWTLAGTGIALSPDGGRIFVPDMRGSYGRVFVADRNLELVEEIDVEAASPNHQLPRIYDLAVSRDGRRLYGVMGGFSPDLWTPNHPVQVLVIDLERGVLERTIPIGDNSRTGRFIFVR